MDKSAVDNIEPVQHSGAPQRMHIEVTGSVQGLGFRPFVYRLAGEMRLNGWVRNYPGGVQIEIEGTRRKLDRFIRRIETDKPPHATIQNLKCDIQTPVGYRTFTVEKSEQTGEKTARILPDIATCPDCLAEIFDPGNQRYRYPFTNCTNCGPRYSIIESLPYDRGNTTMGDFTMCAQCRAEYEDPASRRFHAQPNACPACGPHLELWDARGNVLAKHDRALTAACKAVMAGKILALKGLGGVQLLAHAGNEDALILLRKRKARRSKPFALMYPGLPAIEKDCLVSRMEKDLLCSSAAPIVLLKRVGCESPADRRVSHLVAPENPYLGIMLPYTPLHHLLIKELGLPVVATSGNLSDEPICIDEQEALQKLASVADLFLVHNRRIIRQVDDSIVRVIGGREMIMRSARGYAPTPLHLTGPAPSCIAFGAHQKNSVAVSNGGNAFASQHVGDLTTLETCRAHHRVTASLSRLYEIKPERVACDMHPDYYSTGFAACMQLPVIKVQHHYAHVLSGMVDNRLEAPLLGVSWDGTGLGSDGTIWGGEFLAVTAQSYSRAAHFRTFRLPGGERAAAEPRRSALGLLYEIFGREIFDMLALAPLDSFTESERTVLGEMLAKHVNSPPTSSAGRLFDAVASLAGLCHMADFEGQAAMLLEFAAGAVNTSETYPFCITGQFPPYRLDWEFMIREILDDIVGRLDTSVIAAKFHNTLAEIIVAVALRVGEKKVLLTGGCFQNKYLTERTLRRLKECGLIPYWHRWIPPNDGGIAVGQLMAATWRRCKDGKNVPGSTG
ncbi:MAG: carbamoyltransferase HypF [Candidatus Zixiibacteriota bacterium]|nr:MAG: carbamoyltransferase HypF [candidate division Zixibacteria bacterium]